jgi:uncharacterized integral membrane protein
LSGPGSGIPSRVDPNETSRPVTDTGAGASSEPVEEPGAETAAAPAAPAARPVRIGTGVMPAVVTGIVLAALVLAFVAQNTKRVELEWLWLDFRTTPGVLVLVALFLGVVAAVIVGAIVRRNRRIRLNEREELAHLRAGSIPEDGKS